MAIGRPISLTPNIATKAINSVATANQTDFTVTGGYRINELAVYRNGVRLAQGRDFTANDGTTVTLTNGATVNDVIEFVVFDSFNVADAIVSVASSQTVSGDLNVTGKFYSGSIDPNSLNVAGVGTITRISNTSLVATSSTVSSSFHVGSALTANAAGDVETIGIITAASFSGDITGTATQITVSDESSDTTCFPLFATAASGNLEVKSGTNITFNSSSGALTATSFSGDLTGDVTGDVTGSISGGTVAGSTGTFSGAVNVDATTDSTSSSTGALIVDGGLGVAKNVYIGAGLSVAGTLTYEDVTNVDSVGLVTAKSGVNVTGGQLQVGVAYSVGAAGVATAAGFVGPLTGAVTGNVTGDSAGTHTGAVDLNGGVLTLDADADTTITADTDDQIDIAFGGSDRITLSTGLIDLKNSGSQSQLRLYCESSNAHYTALQAAAHSAYSGNATVTLPASTDTLIGRATTDTLTNKTLSAPSITGDVDIADKIVHTGDTNTALRFPSADTITAETGGSERLRITSGGLVGIGTDNPDEVLSLFGSANNVRLRIDSQNLKRNNYIGVSGADNLEIAVDEDNAGGASSLRIRIDAAERARLNASGNLGIGTVTPARRLHLHDESSDTVQLHITNSTTGVSGSDGISFALGSDESLIINQRESNKIVLKTADTDRVSITSGGDVEFSGTAAGVASCTWDASANSLIFNDNSELKLGDSGDLKIYHNGSNSYIKDNGTGQLILDGEAVILQYGSNSKLTTTTAGVSVTGGVGLSGELDFTGPAHKYIDFYTKASDNTLYNATIRLVNHDSSDFDNAINMEREGGVQLYHAGNQRFATTGAGSTSVGISTVQDFSAIGMLKERVRIMANKLSAATNINVDEGNIWYFTTNETATATPNIRYSASESLNNKMLIGDTITVSIIYKPNGAGYYAALTVDGSAVTEEWNGGAAPSAANAGGYDVLTHTLAKTADATFLCLSNVQNYA